MAYAHHTRTLDGSFADARPDGLWPALSARLASYRVYRRTLDELSQLSDRDLADMGMHRSTIGDVAREAARQA
ncbi:MAG TPA: DUF1127 domain-containing protein [Rubellimicrobium sp.]|nr:DUF1127 domain-containing protein [Rubellimicrobium sp.]